MVHKVQSTFDGLVPPKVLTLFSQEGTIVGINLFLFKQYPHEVSASVQNTGYIDGPVLIPIESGIIVTYDEPVVGFNGYYGRERRTRLREIRKRSDALDNTSHGIIGSLLIQKFFRSESASGENLISVIGDSKLLFDVLNAYPSVFAAASFAFRKLTHQLYNGSCLFVLSYIDDSISPSAVFCKKDRFADRDIFQDFVIVPEIGYRLNIGHGHSSFHYAVTIVP